MAPSPDKLSHLRDLVKEHGVAFEFHPAFSMATGKRVQVGYDVELYGAHDGEHGPHREPQAGCDRCAEVWERLREIVAEIVTAEGGDSIYRVDPFRPGLTLANKRKGPDGRDREAVELVLEIRHKGEHGEGIDPCEEECLRPVIDSLREVGAHEGA